MTDNPNEPVIVAIYYDSFKAQIVSNYLDQFEIESRISGRTNQFESGEPIHVLVRAADVERAKKLIHVFEKS